MRSSLAWQSVPFSFAFRGIHLYELVLNRSGIIKGGVIGGIEQSGKWKLDVRFNKNNLIKKIQRIAANKDKIHVFNMDVIEFLQKEVSKLDISNTFIYLDPPYAGTMNDYFGFYGLLDSYIAGEQALPFENNFMDRKTIVEQFDKLFSSLSKFKYWMLSYNSRSKPTKDELLSIISKYASSVEVYEMPYAYKVTGKEKKNKDVEYLFIARSKSYGK